MLQIVSIIAGFIIPKLVLESFGSEVNGVVSSINQFLNYITLAEGGFTSIIYANLYKPLVENDEEKISKILYSSKKFYNKISFLYIGYSIILAVVYPLVVDSSFSYEYVFSLVLILSLKLLIQYMFSLTLRTLLIADKKLYINSIVQIFLTIIQIVITFFVVKLYPNIHILKLVTALAYILQPLVFGLYIRKHYNLDLSKKANKDNHDDVSISKQRWNGFAVHFASFVNQSTDITILTILSLLTDISVYSVYALVTTSLGGLVTAITTGLNSSLGHDFARNNLNEINDKLDSYEYIMNLLSFFLFGVAGLLITPFVLIYTQNVVDANYNQPLFGVLLCISAVIKLIRLPHSNLAYAANKYKEIKYPAFIQVAINVVLSIVLVFPLGLNGIIIGTIVSMIYKTVFHIYFTKKIIGRKQLIFYKKIVVFVITTAIGVLLSIAFVPAVNVDILSWVVHGLIYSGIFIVLFAIMSFLFFRKELKNFYNYLKR